MPLPPLKDTEGTIERVVSTLRVVPPVAFLGTTLMGLNGAQTASLVLLPFSPRGFRAFNRWAAERWWGACVSLSRSVNGVSVVVTGDPIPDGENAIVILNHQDMADITFVLDYAETKGRLGDLKWMVKDVIKYVPGVGWGMLFLDCIFLKRDWAEDKESIRRTFARLRDNDVPVWLLSFSEGTRITADKLAAAKEHARSHGMPEPRHVLLPRPKGFTATVEGLRDHVGAVYDITIGYEGGVPTIGQFVRGLSPRAHLHVRRFPIDELPADEPGLAEWLRARFVEKDELLERYYATGSF